MKILRSYCALGLLAATIGLVGCTGGSISNYQTERETKVAGKDLNAEEYNRIVENPYLTAKDHPQSTFSTSVDTASYSIVRRFLNGNQLPPADAVRIADFINSFDYAYPEPGNDHPVALGLEMAPCPWQPQHHLLKIAVKARSISPGDMPARNFVFLIDTSGSMAGDERLPLVKQSLELLVHQLGERDRVSIVTYAGDARLVLAPTAGNEPKKIMSAIRGLVTGGSTNGGGGITLAYEQARKSFIEGGVNRVILATDGDFNVGVSSEGDLVRLVEKERNSGVFLTVLGYGMGNLKDNKLEQLAHHGNGHYGYIDTIDEARRIFVDQGGALAVVARDVKIQAEFNHRQVNAYRLIGYESRIMRNEDFRNDAKDAGDMGSGHTCTALYEIVPVGVSIPVQNAGDLKYQKAAEDAPAAKSGEWLTVRLRYKPVDRDDAKELAVVLPEQGVTTRPSDDFRFAAATAGFGMLLRDSEYKGSATFQSIHDLAVNAAGNDRNGSRSEFVRLVDKARQLKK